VLVACGREHTVAVGDSGDVFSWGWGEAGRLGIGEVGKTLSPVRIDTYLGLKRQSGPINRSGGPKVQSIGVACGREHTLILTTSGQVYACGPGYGGRLGLGASSKDVLYPTLVGHGTVASHSTAGDGGTVGRDGNDLEHESVVSAAAGDMHSAVSTASGCVYTWGFGATGALGHGGGASGQGQGGGLANCLVPKRVDAFLTDFRDFVDVGSVSCGAYHTLALSKAGAVYAFGDGESGALGLQDRGDEATHRAATPRLVHGPWERPKRGKSSGAAVRPRRRDSSSSDSADFDYGEMRTTSSDDDEDEEDDEEDGGGVDRGTFSIASVCAGHLSSAAVDRQGRLYTWGCALAEDGVAPSPHDLTPRLVGVANRRVHGSGSGSGEGEGEEGSGGEEQAVKFRSVGMGGYHTVAVTQVHDRWGRPFDAQFGGLPKGLQLPTAKHTPSSAKGMEEHAAKQGERALERVAEEERERAFEREQARRAAHPHKASAKGPGFDRGRGARGGGPGLRAASRSRFRRANGGGGDGGAAGDGGGGPNGGSCGGAVVGRVLVAPSAANPGGQQPGLIVAAGIISSKRR